MTDIFDADVIEVDGMIRKEALYVANGIHSDVEIPRIGRCDENKVV